LRIYRAYVLQSLPRQRSWLQRLLSCSVCGAAAADVACVGGPDAALAAADGSAEHEQVVLLLSLAKTAFSDASEVHTGILQAVYCACTGGWQRLIKVCGRVAVSFQLLYGLAANAVAGMACVATIMHWRPFLWKRHMLFVHGCVRLLSLAENSI
jgi:hypothetical protein